MIYKKGETGNKRGRPIGAKNKVNANLKQLLQKLCEEEFENVKQAFQELNGKDKIVMYEKLLQYILPKALNTNVNLNELTENQINTIIEKL